jgi:hypothetical protein
VFRVKDFDYMFYSMEKYIFLDFQTVHTIEIIKSNEFSILLIFLFLILHFISYKNGNIVKSISKLKLKYWFVFLLSVFLPLTLFYLGSSEEFIYFQF